MQTLSDNDKRIARNLLLNQYQQTVYAIKVLNMSHESLLIKNLKDKMEGWPLLPFILYKSPSPSSHSLFSLVKQEYINDFLTLATAVAKEFQLNNEQSQVLFSSAHSMNTSEKPITLVHGVSFLFLNSAFYFFLNTTTYNFYNRCLELEKVS